MDKEDQRVRVFISYSHRDSRWLERLRTHLAPLWQDHDIEVWDDTKIRPGSKWREDIRNALDTASVAVLILSADFLASDFVRTNELPPLLQAAQEEGVLILPIIASPSLYLRNSALAQLQTVNNPSMPLISSSEADQEATFLKVAEAILSRASEPRSQSRSAAPFERNDKDESFLRRSTWLRLVKIGDWIFDPDEGRIIGAGMQAYLLSRSDYGYEPFDIYTWLEFSNFRHTSAGTMGMNAGIVLGWVEEEQVHRYYHVLLTGREMLIERIGFNGGDDYSDFEHLTNRVTFPIELGWPVELRISVDREQLTVCSKGELLLSMDRPPGIVGRVGLRPWRSKLDCLKFNVSEQSNSEVRARKPAAES